MSRAHKCTICVTKCWKCPGNQWNLEVGMCHCVSTLKLSTKYKVEYTVPQLKVRVNELWKAEGRKITVITSRRRVWKIFYNVVLADMFCVEKLFTLFVRKKIIICTIYSKKYSTSNLIHHDKSNLTFSYLNLYIYMHRVK